MGVLKFLIAAVTLLLVTSGSVPICSLDAPAAYANSCTQNCRRQHNSCRISTKGSRRCDAQLRSCLRRCLK